MAASNSRLVGTPRWYPGSVVLVAARSVEVDHRTARSGSCCSAYWKFSLPTCKHVKGYINNAAVRSQHLCSCVCCCQNYSCCASTAPV